MLLWLLAILILSGGLWLLFCGDDGLLSLFSNSRERERLQRVVGVLHELQETLEAGLFPSDGRWHALGSLPAPWGPLAAGSIGELRKQGGSLVPTLKRLRAMAQEHLEALEYARAKAAQSLAQAMVCFALVPLVGTTLYFLLPGLNEQTWLWIGVCFFAAILAAMGASWMATLAQNARWAGLPRAQRPWILAAQCAGERFLALVRAGVPADLSWMRACELLIQESPLLAAAWGSSIWAGPVAGVSRGPAAFLVAAGESLKKAVQISLMEGKPCLERAEAVLQGLRQDVRSQVERELSVLPTQALKPLFLFVAPAMFGMLAAGILLSWSELTGGAWN